MLAENTSACVIIPCYFLSHSQYISNNGTVFTFKTNKDAPRYKIINIDITKPEPVSICFCVCQSADLSVCLFVWLPVRMSVSSLVHVFTVGLFDDKKQNKETNKSKES